MVAGQLVIIVREYVGGACSVESRYYEDDGDGRTLVATAREIVDSEDLLGFEAVVTAARRTLSR